MRDFFVLKDPQSDSERFAILWRATIPIGAHFWNPEDAQRVFLAHFRTLTYLSEQEIRDQLAEMGLPSDDIEDQIERARNMYAGNEQTTWERVTTVGYRNQHGQEVIRKTAAAGRVQGQRVFVLRCSRCGHTYRTDGCDIHPRQCPTCQQGPPGLP